MRRIFPLSTLFAIALSAFSPSKAAALEIEVCNDCTLSAMKNTAIRNGASDVHVVDLENETLKRYVVISEREGDFVIKAARETTPDVAVKNEFAAVKNAKRGVYDEIFSITPVAQSVAGSAWDLPGSSSKQNAVGNWILDNQTLNQAVGHYTTLVFSFIGKAVGINFVIEVSFSDGSTATYRIAGIDSAGQLVLELQSAMDASNNDIPLTLSGFTGTFSFPHGGAGVMERAASNFGGSLFITGPTGSSGSVNVTCKRVSSGRYECSATVNE